MKVWALYDTDEEGEIAGITGVTTDAGTAWLWRAKSPLSRAEEFDPDDALSDVLAILAMNATEGAAPMIGAQEAFQRSARR